MIAVAFLWHQHQPYYPDDIAGEVLMPWVRLHGVKDYYGMAMHLKEMPEMACTVNLVPTLLLQIQQYVDGSITDKLMDISLIPADELTEEDRLYILGNFFMADPEQMIRPLPRFHELYQLRRLRTESSQNALSRFQEQDYRDLQVLFNLAWVHPIAYEQDANLVALREKGRNYSEADKQWLLKKHLEMMQSIIPLHKELLERGQIEISTTPFYHPILPLLLDKKLAREALPETHLPQYTGGYPCDAELHIQRAVAQHTEIFGQPPRGMWPAEGSVCQAMIPLLANYGIRWIATDEEILAQSTQGFISRDGRGQVRNPERMYRPYRVREEDRELAILFRDHVLSDRIGFHYQRNEPIEAVEDFLDNILEIGRNIQSQETPLVTVILDGENCWEHFPDGGVTFLRTLYSRLVSHPEIEPVKISSFLERQPPRDSLPRLFAGSWIGHSFATWIGHEEDNLAWDALDKTREHLMQRTEQGHIPQDRLKKAWDELYIAQGSDWFWWYGDDHSSSQDELFDYLFRKHLQNVFLLLGDLPPAFLGKAIKSRQNRPLHTSPRNFLNVKVDGRHNFFDWLGAGRYSAASHRGSMALVTPGPIREVHFGFDLEFLLIRVDFDVSARLALRDYDTVRIGFQAPDRCDLFLRRLPDQQTGEVTSLWADLFSHGEKVSIDPMQQVRVGLDRILEVAIPFAILGVEPNEPVTFFVDLLQKNQSRDRVPRDGTIHLTRPTPDFEQIMWQV